MVRRLRLQVAISLLGWSALGVTSIASLGCKDKSEDDSSKDDEPRKKKKRKKSDDDDDDSKKKKKSDDDEPDPKKKTGDDDDKPPKKKVKTGDEEPDPDAPKKSSGDKLAPTDEALKAGSEKNVAVFFEGEKHDLKFGKAYAGYGGLHVTLSTEKTPCSYAPPSDDTYTVEFDLPPGPGDNFFAGHAIGVSLFWNSSRVKLKSSFGNPNVMSLTVDPFKLAEGEHLKGNIRFDAKTQVSQPDGTRPTYEYKGIGPFDVTICDDYSHFSKLKGEPATAPAGNVSGTFASNKFEAKSVLAIAIRDYSNGGEYIDAIEFYPVEANCSDRFSLWKSESWFVVRQIGGTHKSNKLTGQQPADATFNLHTTLGGSSTPKWFGGGGRRAWVRLDKIEYTSSSKISGEVMAASMPGVKPDETGQIGGHFTAKVCGSAF